MRLKLLIAALLLGLGSLAISLMYPFQAVGDDCGELMMAATQANAAAERDARKAPAAAAQTAKAEAACGALAKTGEKASGSK
jgi:hypothetical protein